MYVCGEIFLLTVHRLPPEEVRDAILEAQTFYFMLSRETKKAAKKVIHLTYGLRNYEHHKLILVHKKG